MRAAHALDKRKGNNYRYQRALQIEREERERKALETKWNQIYKGTHGRNTK